MTAPLRPVPTGWIAPEVEGSPFGFLRVAAGGEIQSWNSKLAALTEADPGLRVGEPVWRLFEDPSPLRRWVSAVGRGEEGGSEFGGLIRRSGPPLWVRWTAVRSPGPGPGMVDLWVEPPSGSGRGDEDRLANQRLRILQSLAGALAHDLKNFLTVILGEAGLLGSESEEGAQDPGVLAIQAAGELALQLAGDLRSMEPEREARSHAFGPAPLLERWVRAVRAEMGPRLELTLSLEGELPLLHLHPLSFLQIVDDLVRAGRERLPPGGGLRIRARERDRGTGGAVEASGRREIEIVVSGDPLPFVETSEEGEEDLRALALRLGGDLRWAEKGLRLILPAASLDWVRSEGEETADSPDPPAPRSRIMLVEDEATVLALASRLLERAGFQILPYASPLEALNALHNPDLTVDLLLTDVRMPSLGGDELARLALHIRPALPILIVSAYPAEALLEDLLDSGRVAFLPKPYSSDDLVREISRLQVF